MKDIKLEHTLTIEGAFTTMEPTPSNIMTTHETIRDTILKQIYPVLVPTCRTRDDIVTMRIDGMEGVRVVFLIVGIKQLLSKTTQLKYRITPQDIANAVNRNQYKYTFATMSETLNLPAFPDEMPMYILTNAEMNYGAGLIMNNSVLRHILDKMNEDVYILPSSVHELIVLPASFVDDVKYLTDMVHSINLSCVDPKDRLSNDVYKVDYTTMKIRTIPYRP